MVTYCHILPTSLWMDEWAIHTITAIHIIQTIYIKNLIKPFKGIKLFIYHFSLHCTLNFYSILT